MVKITTAMDIPGETTEKQHNWYNKIYHWMDPPHRILEIGCAWGRSSWAWLDCIEHKDSYLEILDTWSYSRPKPINPSLGPRLMAWPTYYDEIKQIFPNLNQKDILNHNLIQHKHYTKLKSVYTGNSREFVEKHNVLDMYDIVYLDGDHSEINVYNELNHFNGVKIICGDDFCQSQPGVIKAICRFYGSNYTTYKLYTDPDARFFVLKRVDV